MIRSYFRLIFFGVIVALFIMVLTSTTSSINLDYSITSQIIITLMALQLTFMIYRDLQYILNMLGLKLLFDYMVYMKDEVVVEGAINLNQCVQEVNLQELCISRC